MLKIVIPLLLALMGTPLAFAGDLPVLSLPEGTNSVVLSVRNRGETDLSGVALTVDRSALPSWLSVQGTMQAVDAPKGTKAPDRLSLTFHSDTAVKKGAY